MELSVSICLVLTLSLVTASPYGYGAKSGAVARAEATASAGSLDSLPHAPLTVPGSGFSGSFSKSSSSSFASASASSSSSSFSYSGAGPGVVAGFGKQFGCDGDCQNGVKNNLGPSGHGSSINGGFGGHNFAGASASAGAIANVPIAVDQPCHGPNCFGNSVKKCTSSQCGGINTNANGNNVESSESNKDDSNDFSVNQPQLTESDYTKANNNGYQKSDINNGLKQSSPIVPFDKQVNNDNDKVVDCQGPACVGFLPLTENESNNKNLNKQTPSETPYQEQACATHDCKLSASTNQRKPSSYNVPILGPQINVEKENSLCTSGNCQLANHVENHNYDEKTLQSFKPNKPSTTLQLPTDSSGETALCNSNDCNNPSYQGEPAGSHIEAGHKINKPVFNYNIPKPYDSANTPQYTQDQELSGIKKLVNPETTPSPSHTPNVSTGSGNVPNFELNSSYYSNRQAGSTDKTGAERYDNTHQTTGPQLSNIDNLHHPTINSATNPTESGINKPVHQPVLSNPNPVTKPTGTFFDASKISPPRSEINPSRGIPSSGHSFYPGDANNNGAFPSYSNKRPSNSEINSPTGSDGDLICAYGNCASAPQSSQPISNRPFDINSNIPSYFPKIPLNNQMGCTSPNCQPHFGFENSPKIKPTSPNSSITEKFNPAKTDSEVLLTNKGNKIYSGGFGGPVGILSANNNDKPTSSIFINPSDTNHNAPQNTFSPPQTSIEPSSIPSLPAHSKQPSTSEQQPLSTDNLNKPGSFVPIVANIQSDENKRPYTGGFGGPAGLLKPNEFTIPPTIPKVGNCSPSQGNCNPSQRTQHGLSGALGTSHAGANAAADANANAASFSGSFGGPPGLFKPFDEGKPDQTGNALGKHRNDFGNLGPSHVQPHSYGVGGNHANSAASASAGTGSYGHSGGCNTGCSSNGAGQDQSAAFGQSSNGVQHSLNHASSIASAKSVAGSYAHGSSIATASAHASAGASVKGGAWK
ncbi:probable serine/threonine-protein kinase DDB_G0282963 [Pieris rapae]|uniref:probable serine/threonine-protein kinase DDB_G0282963 n=1 Tax=Pieris rapae TaxID=64459 RepID=UPI001E27C336|nr:probable serine/threonine-protein kinase DDB_G0282963 [Pieris rapae]